MAKNPGAAYFQDSPDWQNIKYSYEQLRA